jgi:hypothetical protein
MVPISTVGARHLDVAMYEHELVVVNILSAAPTVTVLESTPSSIDWVSPQSALSFGQLARAISRCFQNSEFFIAAVELNSSHEPTPIRPPGTQHEPAKGVADAVGMYSSFAVA